MQAMKSPTNTIAACAIFATFSSFAQTEPGQADMALAKAKNCTSCHAPNRKIVGPAFQDISARYRGDNAAAAALANKVINGGGGAWGVLKMPANHQVSEAEARRLVLWILSQQPSNAAPAKQ